jgi:hypothetical protein
MSVAGEGRFNSAIEVVTDNEMIVNARSFAVFREIWGN